MCFWCLDLSHALILIRLFDSVVLDSTKGWICIGLVVMNPCCSYLDE